MVHAAWTEIVSVCLLLKIEKRFNGWDGEDELALFDRDVHLLASQESSLLNALAGESLIPGVKLRRLVQV